jgi:hypothetical protein
MSVSAVITALFSDAFDQILLVRIAQLNPDVVFDHAVSEGDTKTYYIHLIDGFLETKGDSFIKEFFTSNQDVLVLAFLKREGIDHEPRSDDNSEGPDGSAEKSGDDTGDGAE